MLKDRLKDYRIVLASGSPRRHHLLKGLDLDFEIDVRSVEETFPERLRGAEITDYLAELKASPFTAIKDDQIIITADTIVWLHGRAINKPANRAEAEQMLGELSGEMHEVITSVSFKGKRFQRTVNDTTRVWFRNLSRDEIAYYITTYQPFDKAGSYGVQEWIGYIGIERLEGCYFNVMGLPTRLVYKTLMELAIR